MQKAPRLCRGVFCAGLAALFFFSLGGSSPAQAGRGGTQVDDSLLRLEGGAAARREARCPLPGSKKGPPPGRAAAP